MLGRIIILGPFVKSGKGGVRTFPFTLGGVLEQGLDGEPVEGASLVVFHRVGREIAKVE